ncbi:hypothetical protein EW146_g7417 [Bondarzewia mesenterica]|uniref:Uncharacterized protein n=1 Tax=Bondarzewia mesenterica TaxID=1095465 RepID=A0A4V3XE92_9AGAM|nr:hypothetical protein EW146_g7417 [Bondarzewia mesenterica]
MFDIPLKKAKYIAKLRKFIAHYQEALQEIKAKLLAGELKNDVKVEADADGVEASKKNSKKPLLELAFAEDGRVMLLAMEEGNQLYLEQMKGLVQSVITAIYHEVTSNKKSAMLWSDLKEHQSEYINAEYLPEEC